MNHKWSGNTCVSCGISRMKKDCKKFVRTYPKLINGVWEDVQVFSFGTAWFYYGPDPKVENLKIAIGFERPECINK